MKTLKRTLKVIIIISIILIIFYLGLYLYVDGKNNEAINYLLQAKKILSEMVLYTFKNEAIIKANPSVEITPILPAGVKLKIPILDESETIKFELPPWKK